MLILRDTREKQGWEFVKQEATVADRKLDTGDYTVEGIEGDLVIERKATPAELAQSITSAAFKKELKRMEEFRHAFLIFEFSWKDLERFPFNSGIPTRLWKKLRVTSNYLIACVNGYRLNGIQCITADNSEFAQHVAYDLMKRYYEYRR